MVVLRGQFRPALCFQLSQVSLGNALIPLEPRAELQFAKL